MTTPNIQSFLDRQQQIAASDLAPEDKLRALETLHTEFDMRLSDLIAHLQEVQAQKGNLRVLRPDLGAGSMRLVDIHVQQRDDTPNEWVVSIY